MWVTVAFMFITHSWFSATFYLPYFHIISGSDYLRFFFNLCDSFERQIVLFLISVGIESMSDLLKVTAKNNRADLEYMCSDS